MKMQTKKEKKTNPKSTRGCRSMNRRTTRKMMRRKSRNRIKKRRRRRKGKRISNSTSKRLGWFLNKRSQTRKIRCHCWGMKNTWLSRKIRWRKQREEGGNLILQVTKIGGTFKCRYILKFEPLKNKWKFEPLKANKTKFILFKSNFPLKSKRIELYFLI